MRENGNSIMEVIRKNIIDDWEPMLRKNRVSLEDKWLKPYKKIRRDHLPHFAGEIAYIAALADREDGLEDKISVTFGPVYHFYNQDTLDRFLARAEKILEAAEI